MPTPETLYRFHVDYPGKYGEMETGTVWAANREGVTEALTYQTWGSRASPRGDRIHITGPDRVGVHCLNRGWIDGPHEIRAVTAQAAE